MSHVAEPPVRPRPDIRRPRGVSSDAQTLLNQERRVWEVRTPVVDSTARLKASLDEIAQLAALEEDWNVEGARPIDPSAIEMASRLVRAVEKAVRQGSMTWAAPEVGPVPDGSVALAWDNGGRQLLVVCRPGEASVECITREPGQPGVRHIVSEVNVVPLALWALSDV